MSMSAVEEQPALLQSGNVAGVRSMNNEDNRGGRRALGQRGGRGGALLSSSRGRGRRPHTSSGDVRVFDRGISMHESSSRVDGTEVIRVASLVSSFDVFTC